ncbi:ribonuclease H-like domain-containing protein [uncultured Varibaculum sp.]|uniref:ribonuclease H-like domain-containing protein n=1 Tax=uncultured Varibaculum sp. TaxID=413896 RepID=UPI002598A9CF|nr:ribonuclease H-like domain-containing protein [uncultured Varibaculum sp.]
MPDSSRLLAVSEVAHAANCQWRLWCYLTGHTQLESPDVFHRYIGDLTSAEEEKIAAKYRATGIVFQTSLTLTSEHLTGTLPFLVYEDAAWVLQMARFSAHARQDSVNLLAGYAHLAQANQELLNADFPALAAALAPCAQILLADGKTVDFPLEELEELWEPIAEQARALATDQDLLPATPEEAWRALDTVCGSCSHCRWALERYDDPLLISGVGPGLRQELRAENIFTASGFATNPPDGYSPELIRQAQLQVAQHPGELLLETNPLSPALMALPEPRPGDVYLDFENDSLWGWTLKDHTGLIYLGGVVCCDEDSWGQQKSLTPALPIRGQESHPATGSINVAEEVGELSSRIGGKYRSFWAHNRAQERQLLIDLLDFLRQRFRRFPQMHIYHYSPQERLYLQRLSSRHGLLKGEVRDLLTSDGPMRDLQQVVQSAIRTGQGGYSLKEMEPFYMGSWMRSTDLDNGADSVIVYDELSRAGALDPGAELNAEDAEQLRLLALYNEYDCCSTALLHHWLIAQRSRPRLRAKLDPADLAIK